jgi:hypothetical protein
MRPSRGPVVESITLTRLSLLFRDTWPTGSEEIASRTATAATRVTADERQR